MTKKTQVSRFVRFIEDQYQMESERDYHEATERTVSFNFPASDACMLASIAKRFGKSTASLGGELFAQHVRELFIGLSADDRRKLAVEADAEQTRYQESKGIKLTDLDGNPAACREWQSYADICDRLDAEGEAK